VETITLQELEGFLSELLQALQLTFQSGEVLPDEFLGEIAKTLEFLYDRIQAMKSGQGPPQSPKPPIEPGGQSSNVEGFAFDDKNNRLFVRFLGPYPQREGPVYSYENVPPIIFDLLRKGAVPARTNGQNKWGKWWKGKVPSLGASVYTLLKLGGFPYQKVA
jgi:hypothetical protein